MRRFAPQLTAQLFCICLLLFFASNSNGQTVSRPTSQQQIQNREWARGNVADRLNFSQYQQALERARLAMKNDFRKLQVVNNQLMLRVFRPTGTEKITNKEIRSSLGEIKKLAERLRLNFGFAKTEAVLTSEIALSKGLDRLDDAVVRFVQNPLFQQPRVYDIELASQAEKDIGEVLTLVDVLRKLTKE